MGRAWSRNGFADGSEAIAHATNQRPLADRVNERLVELAFDWDGTVGYAENRFRMVRSIDGGLDQSSSSRGLMDLAAR